MRTLPDDDDCTERELPASVRARRAATETRAVLRQADAAWSPYSCPASSRCCQLTKTQRQPWLWPSEGRVLRDALVAARRPLPPPRTDGGCPFLDDAGRRCTVYEARPFGCRTFFCGDIVGPSRMPTTATDALLARLQAINLEADETAEPLQLLDWHAAQR